MDALAKWDSPSLRNIFSPVAETVWCRPGRGSAGWSASSRSLWSKEAQDQGQVFSGMTQDPSNGHHQTNHPGFFIPEEHQVEPMVGASGLGLRRRWLQSKILGTQRGPGKALNVLHAEEAQQVWWLQAERGASARTVWLHSGPRTKGLALPWLGQRAVLPAERSRCASQQQGLSQCSLLSGLLLRSWAPPSLQVLLEMVKTRWQEAGPDQQVTTRRPGGERSPLMRRQ